MIKKNVVLSLVLAGLVVVSYLIPKSAYADNITINRLYGSNRYETSVAISEEGWKNADNVVIATGENFADALCAVPFAKSKDAPIILSSKNSLSAQSISQIEKLGVKNAYIIGGSGVISENVANQLSSKGISVSRIWGKNRYETSVKVAENIGTSNGVVVVTGLNFADALSVAPIAAKKSMPIILSASNVLPKEVQTYLNGKSIPTSYVIGGAAVLSDTVENALPNAIRIGGNNKYETNINILAYFENELSFDKVFVATGLDFPDALSGAALAPKYNAPLVLTSNKLPIVSDNYLVTKNISEINLLGGTGVIGSEIENKLKEYVAVQFSIVSIE